jgi:hypothetical protein
MATKVHAYKIGDRVRVTQGSHDIQLRGFVGTVVSIPTHGEIGVDFGMNVGGVTWDLNSLLRMPTGRFMGDYALELLETDWDS